VAHNARFDYGFIRGELRHAGLCYAAQLACTVKLSRKLYPEMPRHNLDAVMAHHGIACASRHRALPDAQVLWALWQKLRAEWPAETLDAAIAEVARHQLLPPQFPAELIDEIPESSGVYRFFGVGDALIYVGKANNLRERVLGHFAGTNRNSKSRRLSEQTLRIEWTETAGELGALLLEARLVRELKPVYNRRLRGGETFTWMIGDGAARPRIVDLDREPLGQEDAFGLYRSERAARNALSKLARDEKLCLKAMQLEAGAGSCFGYQLGRCAGACVGAESLARHNVRLKLAMIKLRLKAWPWDGPVGISESSPTGLNQIHVVDAWQYLGSLAGADHFDANACLDTQFDRAAQFDADAYRLLSRYLKPGARNVRRLSSPRSGGSRSASIGTGGAGMVIDEY
jgi:DNA polymerase-3 subunit epsilon